MLQLRPIVLESPDLRREIRLQSLILLPRESSFLLQAFGQKLSVLRAQNVESCRGAAKERVNGSWLFQTEVDIVIENVVTARATVC